MKLFFITLLIVNIAFASSAFLNSKNANVFTQIQKIENSDFGKKLMDTIALQIENKAPLEDVAKLLADLKSNLIKQNEDHKMENDKYQANCHKKIEDLNNKISNAKEEISAASEEITRRTKAIAQNKEIIANREKQLGILANREKSLERNYKLDQEAFEKRIAEHKSVIEALDIIIPRLSQIKGQPSEKNTVFAELAKIGTNNPIAALVTVATSLDADALENVINKLREIKASVAASLEQDQAAQQKSDEDYNSMKQEISSVRVSNQQELAAEKKALAENEDEKAAQINRLNRYTEIKEQATKQLADTKADCATKQKKWENDTAQRNSEIGIVVQVQQILATRIDNMKQYLKERVNQ